MNYCSSVGLLFDIVGALLLFRYGLPSKYVTGSYELREGGLDKVDEEKNKRIKLWSNVGLVFLILGFVGQFLASLDLCFCKCL